MINYLESYDEFLYKANIKIYPLFYLLCKYWVCLKQDLPRSRLCSLGILCTLWNVVSIAL